MEKARREVDVIEVRDPTSDKHVAEGQSLELTGIAGGLNKGKAPHAPGFGHLILATDKRANATAEQTARSSADPSTAIEQHGIDVDFLRTQMLAPEPEAQERMNKAAQSLADGHPVDEEEISSAVAADQTEANEQRPRATPRPGNKPRKDYTPGI